MQEMELQHLRHVLEEVGDNKLQAGKVLGISRGKLYRLLGELKMKAPPQAA